MGSGFRVQSSEFRVDGRYSFATNGHKLSRTRKLITHYNNKISDFQFGNEKFFVRSRKSRGWAEAYIWYAAQLTPQIDADIAKKGHLWMEI